MSLIRDIKLFFEWKKTINKFKKNILENFNNGLTAIKIDRAHRIHYVINIPTEMIDEPYNLRKSDIDILVQDKIKREVSKLSEYLNSIGLGELYDYYQPIEKLEKYSYLVVIGFKLIDSVSLSKFIFWSKIIITFLSILSTILLLVI
jgi:hypothetical protein